MTTVKRGTLYALGIGPGDPELLTLKAVRILRESPVVVVPRGREDGESLALSIVSQVVALADKRVVEAHFPMKKGSQREALLPAAQELIEILGSGQDVAFITLGDSVLYSTFFHLYDAMVSMSPDVEFSVELVPGVSSVNAAAARAGVSLALANERVAILPATYVEDMEVVLREFESIVLMKVHRVIDRVRDGLTRQGLLGSATYVSRVGLAGEIVKPLAQVTDEDLNYFSVIIVRKDAQERHE